MRECHEYSQTGGEVAKIIVMTMPHRLARRLAHPPRHQTLCVSNGRQALELIQAQPVDMVISDMNMPELDGLGFVKALRQFAGDRLPVIILSARCDQQELMDALSSYGVKVYPKPFLPSYMVTEIHRLLEGAGMTQAGGVS
jgi:two-component system chemotaxis response regulator CheY